MKLMLDLNVILDVVQKRQPHYPASAEILNIALKSNVGVVPSHAITTVHYLVSKHADKATANDLLDWLLQNFSIAATSKETFLLARQSNMPDFEDAVVSASAQEQNCHFIITRNRKDFLNSKIQALTPAEFLALQFN